MLESIRAYALEQLDTTGETDATRRRHAEFYRQLAEQAEPLLLVPSQRADWMWQLEKDQANVRGALDWSVGRDGDLQTGVALAGALGWFWLMSGRLLEGESWLDKLLARRPTGDDSLAWARVLHGSALVQWGQGKLTEAAAHEEARQQLTKRRRRISSVSPVTGRSGARAADAGAPEPRGRPLHDLVARSAHTPAVARRRFGR
jgi:hypothetical protein